MAQIIPLKTSQKLLFRNHTVIPCYKRNPFEKCYKNTFENQRSFGKQIADSFMDRNVINVLAVAPTQSGKTGSMIAFCYESMNRRELRVKKEHVFVITGHSSLEWLEQTRSRFPSWMRQQIFHRNHFKRLKQRICALSNVILIIDECHIASKQGQTLYQLIQDISPQLHARNFKLVQVSATPENLTQSFSDKWQNAHRLCHMAVPSNYLSVEALHVQNRIRIAKDLCAFDAQSNSVQDVAYDNIREIIPLIQNMPPSYHIIRTPRAHKHHVVIRNFKLVFESFNAIYISSNDIDNAQFDALLANPPLHHTFIFIKDKLRCAKTIHHQFIGILYERWVSKPNRTSILQGLLGRITGFHSNSQAIVFSLV